MGGLNSFGGLIPTPADASWESIAHLAVHYPNFVLKDKRQLGEGSDVMGQQVDQSDSVKVDPFSGRVHKQFTHGKKV